MSQNVNALVLRLIKARGTFTNKDLAERLGISRQATHKHLAKLVAGGALIAQGSGRGAHYSAPGSASLRLRRAGLDEAMVWERVRSAPHLDDVEASDLAIIGYAFTEMLNNAIDHSSAKFITISWQRRQREITFEISDNGVGIFEHLRKALHLESQLVAIQELSKGKITTDPSRHTGEGIFFTSKLASYFEIESGELRWIVDNLRADVAVGEAEKLRRGTVVSFSLRLGSKLRLEDVFAEYTKDFEFSKSLIHVKLFEHGETFISRSEAKRLTRGLERFREVILDFVHVKLVAQGFADELFRVWARQHQRTRLVPTNMSDPVAFMVARALHGAKADQRKA